MPTPETAMAQVAAVLTGIDPRDEQAVDHFYERVLHQYPASSRALISEFLISLTRDASEDELTNLKASMIGLTAPRRSANRDGSRPVGQKSA